MALMANINRGKSSRAYRPSDFDPFAPLPPPLTAEQKERAAMAFAAAWKVS